MERDGVVGQRSDARVHLRQPLRRKAGQIEKYRRRAIGVTGVIQDLKAKRRELGAQSVPFAIDRHIAFKRHARAVALQRQDEGLGQSDKFRPVERGPNPVELADAEKRLIAAIF